MKDADLVILLGARLNWMLHFGQPPRFSQNVKIVQVDINAEDLGNNTKDCIQIQADIQSFCKQVGFENKINFRIQVLIRLIIKMNENLAKKHYDVDQSIKANWWSTLKEKCAKNKTTIKVKISFSNLLQHSKLQFIMIVRRYFIMLLYYFSFYKNFSEDQKVPLNYYAAYAEVSYDYLK